MIKYIQNCIICGSPLDLRWRCAECGSPCATGHRIYFSSDSTRIAGKRTCYCGQAIITQKSAKENNG